MQSRRTSSSGFTIVELLIVIVVIAILATIVIVAYNGVQNRARISSAQTAVQQVATKIQTFAVDNSDAFPTALTDIGISDTATTTYQYTVNNSASPRTYCVVAIVANVHYYMTQAVTTPTDGDCGPIVAPSSIFGSTYPYTATYWNDGGGHLKVATLFYSNSGSFTIKGGRVYLPSVPAGVSLTIFYVKGWYAGDATIHQPDWSQVPSGIPGQYTTIPSGSLITGWNEVTFPTPGTINPYSGGVDGTSVWVGYYFSDGNGYIFTRSQRDDATPSVNNSHLFLAESSFEASAKRSSNSLSDAQGWQSALYGIDLITVGP